mgnify:CR=1 FL=1
MVTTILIHIIGAVIGIIMLYRSDVASKYIMHKKYPYLTPFVEAPDKIPLAVFCLPVVVFGTIGPVFGVGFMFISYMWFPSFKEFWWAFLHAKVGHNYNS